MRFPTEIEGPVAIVGDLHGQTEKLVSLLSALEKLPEWKRRWLVFIGDLVDRGADSRGGLDLVLELMGKHRRVAVVCGNHDLAMAGAMGLIPAPPHTEWGKRWVEHYDSETTFASYGVEHGNLARLQERVPMGHAELLAGLPWIVEHPELIFVHAGLDTTHPTEMQLQILRQRDYSLQRPVWLCSKELASEAVPRDCKRTVVSGHVRVPQVQMGPRRILVDTSGGTDGPLSCLLMPERQVLSAGGSAVQTGEREADVPEGTRKRWFEFWKRAA